MPSADADLSASKPRNRRVAQILRRLHLYTGLLLFPWAVLYGITAILFNHPSLFSDAPMTLFGAEAFQGLPFENRPTADEIAREVVTRLNEKQNPTIPFEYAGLAKWNREFAFATVQTEGQSINILVDVKFGNGTIRTQPPKPVQESTTAPFAKANGSTRPTKSENIARGTLERYLCADPIHKLIQESIPELLQRLGYPNGKTVVTSVPDIQFLIRAEDQLWTATYNPMTGAISGVPAESVSAQPMSTRRFLLRLHTAHGYPSEANAKWYWAILVDGMGGVLCFWGISGLVMWWQLKSQRRLGFILLIVSGLVATCMGFGMHSALTG